MFLLLEIFFDVFGEAIGIFGSFFFFAWLLGRGIKNGTVTPLKPEELSSIGDSSIGDSSIGSSFGSSDDSSLSTDLAYSHMPGNIWHNNH